MLCTDAGKYEMVIWSKIWMVKEERMKMKRYGSKYEMVMKGGGWLLSIKMVKSWKGENKNISQVLKKLIKYGFKKNSMNKNEIKGKRSYGDLRWRN